MKKLDGSWNKMLRTRREAALIEEFQIEVAGRRCVVKCTEAQAKRYAHDLRDILVARGEIEPACVAASIRGAKMVRFFHLDPYDPAPGLARISQAKRCAAGRRLIAVERTAALKVHAEQALYRLKCRGNT